MPKPTLNSIGDNIVDFEVGGVAVARVETTKTLYRPPAEEGGDPEPYVEHVVYEWRAATAEESEAMGWAPGHLHWAIVARHEDRDEATNEAAALAASA